MPKYGQHVKRVPRRPWYWEPSYVENYGRAPVPAKPQIKSRAVNNDKEGQAGAIGPNWLAGRIQKPEIQSL